MPLTTAKATARHQVKLTHLSRMEGVKSPKKSFVKKSNFQTVIFAIIFVTMNGQTSKLLKKIFYDVQTEGKGEINTA